jgi:predicted HTH transcriptional regulator
VPLPDIATQAAIAKTIQKLDQTRAAIDSFANNLSINPISATGSSQKIDLMLEVIGELADSDKVVTIARGGESKTVEFKETLSLDMRKDSKEKYIEDSAIKTIAAFLNSDGGTLLVGVNDAGAIKGVDEEIDRLYKTTDKFLLHLKNLIRERIGEQFYTFINQRLVIVGTTHVLMIECNSSTSAVFVDEKDFFVRTNPATDKLEGAKLVEYVRNHFRT